VNRQVFGAPDEAADHPATVPAPDTLIG